MEFGQARKCGLLFCPVPEHHFLLIGYSLNRICFPEGLEEITGNCVRNSYCLERICIPDTVTTIGGYAFQGNVSVQKIHISRNARSIGDNSFEDNNCLVECNPLEKVETIGYSVFRRTYSLGEILLPATLTTINNQAFSDTGISRVFIYAKTPPTIGSNVAIPGTIYVPKGCGDAYKNSENWGINAARIQEMDE